MKLSTKKQLTVAVDFELGDIVYMRICAEKSPGMVTGIHVGPGNISYCVTWDDGGCRSHFAMELTSEFMPPDWGEQG